MTSQFEKFDKLFASELLEGETVLWKGRPAGIKIMEAPYGNLYIIRWGICLAFAIFSLWFGLLYGPANELSNSIAVMLVFLLIIAYVAARPLIDVNTIQHKCVYCITNRRAIVSLVGRSYKIKDKHFEDIDEILTDIISGDRGVIYIGGKQKDSHRKGRGDLFIYPNMTGDDDIKKQPLIFYSVENIQDVKTYFPPLTR